MPLDAVIISSYRDTTLSRTSQLRLRLGQRLATIQTIKSFIKNNGELPAVQTSDKLSWHHAIKLSGLSIFSYLYGHFNCEIIDFLEYEESRFNSLLSLSPRFVIISTSFIYSKKTLHNLSSKIKQLCPNTIIICGGPFVLSSYLLYRHREDSEYDTDSPKHDFLFLSNQSNPPVDYFIIANQGLDTLLSLMKTVDSGENIAKIPNIAFVVNDIIQFNLITKTSYGHIDILWEKLPNQFFGKRVTSLQASNGCTFKCNFCNFVKDRKATFIRGFDDIFHDLDKLQKLGIEYVRFADDNFILGRSTLNDFCKIIIRRGFNIKWHAFMRMGNLVGADFDLLKRAGCREILLGLESANSGILKNMNKNIDPRIYRPIIQKLIASGINVASTFIVGYPGETYETAHQTFEFIDSINSFNQPGIFKWSLFPFTLLPGSPIYHPNERKKYNLTGYLQSWSHDTMDSYTAKDLIEMAYNNIRGVGPGYTSDNLDDFYALTPANRLKFTMLRYELSKLNRRVTLEDCKKTFEGILDQ